MKKLAFMFVAVAAMSFASCGGQNQANNEAEDSVEVVAEETCEADSCCADSVCCADSAAAEVVAE